MDQPVKSRRSQTRCQSPCESDVVRPLHTMEHLQEKPAKSGGTRTTRSDRNDCAKLEGKVLKTGSVRARRPATRTTRRTQNDARSGTSERESGRQGNPTGESAIVSDPSQGIRHGFDHRLYCISIKVDHIIILNHEGATLNIRFPADSHSIRALGIVVSAHTHESIRHSIDKRHRRGFATVCYTSGQNLVHRNMRYPRMVLLAVISIS